MIIARSMIGGGVEIGNRSWIASACIRDGVKIGNDVVVGLGSVVVKDVPDNTIVMGIPARSSEKVQK